MFVIVSVIYRPIEQLLSRTIADRRARGLEHRPPAAHAAADPGRLRARVPRRRARAARADRGRPVRRLGGAVLGARRRRARLRGELLRARLAGRAPVVRALRRARVPGGDARGCCSRSRWRSGSPTGRPRWRSAWRRRRSSRWSSCRGRSRAGRRRPARARASATRRRSGSPAAGASRSPCCAIMLAEQTLLNAGVLTADVTADGRRGRRLRLQRAADRARAAAALPGDPGLAPPPPRGARGDARAATEFARAIRITVLAIAGFAGAVALGLLLARPVRDERPVRRRRRPTGAAGSRWSALGMGFHLAAGTLNQAALARDRAGAAAAALAGHRRRVRRLDGQPASSTTSCCAPRSATSARRRCCARLLAVVYRATSFFFRATYEWPFLTVTFLRLTKSRTWTTPRLTVILVLSQRVLR